MRVRKNTQVASVVRSDAGAISSDITLVGGGEVELAAGDYITLQLFQDAGASVNLSENFLVDSDGVSIRAFVSLRKVD